MLAVLALCMTAPANSAVAQTPAPSSAPVSVPAAAPAGAHHHWRHWRRSSHYGHTGHYGHPFGAGGGHGHTLRWHTVRDGHGHRVKQWYYADTGESVSGPDAGDDNTAAMRDLDAPMSRSEREELHAQRTKALDHLAQVEQRVEHDRIERAKKAKARLHRNLGEANSKPRAAK